MTCPTPPASNHERLRLDLMSAGRRMRGVAEAQADFDAARGGLVSFCLDQLLPHLERDERWLTRAGDCPDARLLTVAMRAEGRAMTATIYELIASETSCEAMAATRVLHSLLAAHAHHEELLTAAIRTA